MHLALYDVLGRRITVLVDRDQPAGFHSYRLRADRLASGIYLYRLQAGDVVETKRMVVIK